MAKAPWTDWCWACEKTIILEGKFCGWCGTKQACEKCPVRLDGRLEYCTGCGDARPERSERAVGVHRDRELEERKDHLYMKAKKHDDEDPGCDWLRLLRVPLLMFMSHMLGILVGMSMMYIVLTDRKS